MDEPGAYGKASEQMTDYMFNLVRSLFGKKEGDVTMVDLGSGTGAAARRLTKMHPTIMKATCLNLCKAQNEIARNRATELGLQDRIDVFTGTYEKCPFNDGQFDLAFSQDAFVHAFSKLQSFKEAHRVTKSGGAFIFSDLMCGDGPGVSKDESATFANTNMVNDWLSPEQNVAACTEAGWVDATFVDLTPDIRTSFKLMLNKVQEIIERGGDGISEDLLNAYETNLASRITQVDRGVFKWGVVHATKA